MRNLVNTLLLVGALSLPLVTRAQEKNSEKESPKNFVQAFIGAYNSSNNGIRGAYGTFFNFGAGFSSNLSDQFSLGGRVELRSKEIDISGNTYSGDYRYNQSQKNNLSMIEISAIANYLVPFKRGDYYIGIGATFLNLTEKAEGKVFIYKKQHYLGQEYWSGIPEEIRNFSGENTETGVGIGLNAGTNFDLSQNTRLFIEAVGKFITNELGGISFNVGISQKL